MRFVLVHSMCFYVCIFRAPLSDSRLGLLPTIRLSTTHNSIASLIRSFHSHSVTFISFSSISNPCILSLVPQFEDRLSCSSHSKSIPFPRYQLDNNQVEPANKGLLYLHPIHIVSRQVSSRRELRAEKHAFIRIFMGDDERETSLYRRPGDRLMWGSDAP